MNKQEIRDHLHKLGKQHSALRGQLGHLTEALRAAVVEAAHAGVRTTELAMRAGYSRDRIRKILREEGIEPLSIGRPPKAVAPAAGGP